MTYGRLAANAAGVVSWWVALRGATPLCDRSLAAHLAAACASRRAIVRAPRLP